MNYLKKKNGITLIALVVTNIVEDVYYNGSASAPYGAGWGAKKINGTEVN